MQTITIQRVILMPSSRTQLRALHLTRVRFRLSVFALRFSLFYDYFVDIDEIAAVLCVQMQSPGHRSSESSIESASAHRISIKWTIAYAAARCPQCQHKWQ